MNRKEARWLDLLSQFGIFKVNLKPGRIHVLGDVLSRAPHVMKEDNLAVNTIQVSSLAFDFDFKNNYGGDQFFSPIINGLRGTLPEGSGQRDKILRILPLFRDQKGMLWYQGKVCVPRRSVRDVLHLAHDVKISGHFAFSKTLSRLEGYHWKNKTRDIENYCQGCSTCQQQKDFAGKKFTVPNPLDVPTSRWGSLATDFIVGLPKTSKGFDAITTWVDRLSRRVHFIPCRGTDTAVDTVACFFESIFKHHGLPDNVVSDRDPKFTSKFWTHLMHLCGIRTQMSTSNHPQTDGASEVMNRMVENFLRCYCSYRQDDWDELLPAAEFAYNSARSDDLGASPFEVDLGWKPRSPLGIFRKQSTPIESVDELRNRLQSALDDARFCHEIAKARQSAYTAQKYRPAPYEVGTRVWLNKGLFRDAIAKSQSSDKLSAKRFGPFRITELIGKNVIRVELPENVRIHPVVHVLHTTPYHAQYGHIAPPVAFLPQPVPSATGLLFVVDRILAHRKRGRGFQWLTLMKGTPRHEAQWQPTRDFLDPDGMVTAAFHEYIVEHNLLPHLH